MYTDIKTGFTCNNSCIHCVIAPIRDSLLDEQKPLNSLTEEVKQFINDAIDRGSDTIVLTGGEVTIRKDFHELLEYANSKKLKIVVQTNGRTFSKPAQLETLKNIPNIVVVIAIHGPNDKVHDRITRKKGSFNQTVNAIDTLNHLRNVKICAKIVISNHNAESISETVNFLCKKCIKRIAIAFPHAEDFPEAVFKEVVPRYKSLPNEINRILKLADENSLQVTFETIPYCIMPDSPGFWKRSLDASFAIFGGENPGFMQRTGESHVHEWEKERKEIKQKGKKCRLCVFDKVCEGAWREYIHYFGNEEFIPISDLSVVDKL